MLSDSLYTPFHILYLLSLFFLRARDGYEGARSPARAAEDEQVHLPGHREVTSGCQPKEEGKRGRYVINWPITFEPQQIGTGTPTFPCVSVLLYTGSLYCLLKIACLSISLCLTDGRSVCLSVSIHIMTLYNIPVPEYTGGNRC